MNLRQTNSIALLAVCLSGKLLGQSLEEIRLDAIEKLELHHLKADIATYQGRAAVRIANPGGPGSDYGEGLALVRGASLQNGSIEVTLSGDTAPDAPPELRGFVGIAFRVADLSHFECFYIRPKNGRSED